MTAANDMHFAAERTGGLERGFHAQLAESRRMYAKQEKLLHFEYRLAFRSIV